MLRLPFFWLVEFLLILGLGILLQRAVIRRGVFGVFETFWMGLMVLVGGLQFLHLVVPIDGVVLLGFVTLAGVGWSASGRWRSALAHRGKAVLAGVEGQRTWVAAGIMAVLVLAVAARSAWERMPVAGDTALYHWNVVRWTNEYPAVPGIANLHARLGFNSSYLLWAAMLDNFWADRRTAVLMPGFLLLVVSAQWIANLFLETRPSQLATRLFTLLSLPYLVWHSGTLNPSLYYDSAQNLTFFVLVRSVLDWYCARWERPELEPSTGAWCGFWMGLGCLSFTFKLSGVILPPLCLLLTIWLMWREAPVGWRGRAWWLRLMRLGFLPGLLIAGYLCRNAILSGWVLFPSPILGLHLPWSVPAGVVRHLYETDVRDWARMPAPERLEIPEKGFWYWFPKWYQIFRRSTAHDALWMGAFGLVLWLARPRRRLGKPSDWIPPLFLMGLVALSLVMWFVGAPDLRFAEGLFWCWMALAVTFAITGWIRSKTLAWALASVAAMHLFLYCRGDLVPLVRPSWTSVARSASADVELVTVPNGQSPPLQIYISTNKTDNAPGDSPLPAAPAINSNLMWREPGNLGAGFWQRPPSVTP